MSENTRDTRDRLLDAAETLFASGGFDTVTIRDIASAAEVNVAAVNYHFQGKDRLYKEVLRRVITAKGDRHVAAMESVMGAGDVDLAATLGAFFRTHFEDVLKSESGGNFLKLFVREIHHGSSDVAELIMEALQPMWDSLGRAVIASTPGADPALAPWIVGSLHGQLIHFTMRWCSIHGGGCHDGTDAMRLLFPPLADDVDEYIDLAVEHITRFSVAGIQALIAGQTVEETS